MLDPAVRIRASVAASSWSATMNRNLVNERFAPMAGWPLLMRAQFSYRHQVTKPKVSRAAAGNSAQPGQHEACDQEQHAPPYSKPAKSRAFQKKSAERRAGHQTHRPRHVVHTV